MVTAKNKKRSKKLLLWGIIVLLFVFVVTGIYFLYFEDEELFTPPLDQIKCGGFNQPAQFIDKSTDGNRYFNERQCNEGENCDARCLGYCLAKNDGDIRADCDRIKNELKVPSLTCNPPGECMHRTDRGCGISSSVPYGSEPNQFVKNNWYGGITCLCHVRGSASAWVNVECVPLKLEKNEGEGGKPN